MKNRFQLVSAVALLSCSAGYAQDASQQTGAQNTSDIVGSQGYVNLSFLGDSNRLGVGIDDEGDWFGEYFHVFGNGETSSWVGEAWANDEQAGGLKLNYHWLTGGNLETAADGDAWVGKLFLAADQNAFDDRKATLGFGMEKQSLFWGAYLMKSLTDERLIDRQQLVTPRQIMGVDGNQVFVQDEITTVTISRFEHPYDRGAGVRLGKFFNGGLWRLRGGLDYEEGDFDSDQFTVSLGLEKYFANTGHSLALTAEHYEKDGDFVLDDSDNRATLAYRYNFGARHSGGAYRIHRDFAEKQVTKQIAAKPAVTERKLVANEISVGETTLFDLDRAAVKPESAQLLDGLWARIEKLELTSPIEVVGHTCDLGSDAYNQNLSERRARSVVDYLVSKGIARDRLSWRGAGEQRPRYPNTDQERSKNRRVEINFVSSQPVYKEVVVSPAVAATTTTETIREELGPDVSWVSRALRNPVAHKRTVDVYRYEESDTQVTLGDRTVVNNLPSAQDDAVDTGFNTPIVVAVLANDTDPDGGTLSVTSNSSPANGTAQLNGDGTITYTPNSGFFGTDQFTYTVIDEFGSEATATVTVQVSELPPLQPADDEQQTDRNQPVAIEVLANDTGNGLTISATTDPANGSISVASGLITYTPARDYVGIDTFTYTVTDAEGQTATATVTVTINAANNAPVAVDDAGITAKDTAVTLDVLANDSDADGDALTIVAVDPAVTPFGTVEIVGNQILYTPNPGWWGGDEFNYTIEDGFGGSATATVVLEVTQ